MRRNPGKYLFWSALISLFLSPFVSLSAQHRVTGRVIDDDGGVAGVTLASQYAHQKSASFLTLTDKDGYFDCSVTELPVTIFFSYIAAAPDSLLIATPQECIGISHKLQYVEQNISTVNIYQRKTPSDFRSIDASSTMGQPSVSGGVESVIRTMMGVTANSELSTQYRVRGGNFDENMVYVDGVQIYRPFLIRNGEQEGLSFVNPDMVESLNFSAGSFDASYADKTASVLDVQYRRPRDFEASLQASLLGAQTHIGFVTAHNRLTNSTAFRYHTNRYLMSSTDTKGEYNPTFLDLQSYWTLQLSDSHLSLLCYYAQNRYAFKPKDRETSAGTISDSRKLKIYFEGEEDDAYTTALAALRYSYKSFNTSLQYYRSAEAELYDILGEYWLQQAANVQTEENLSQSEGIGVGGFLQHARNELYTSVLTATADYSYVSDKQELSAGFTFNREQFDEYAQEWELTDSAGYIRPETPDLSLSKVIRADNVLDVNRFSGYIKDILSFNIEGKMLTLEAGLRLSNNSLTHQTLFSPRLSLRFSPSSAWVLKLAGGRYYQAPFFRELHDERGRINSNLDAQQEWHLLLSADHFFTLADIPIRLSMEAYYKRLMDVNPYSIENVRIRYMARNCAHGYAIGFDTRINADLAPGVSSWATLSLLKTEEDVDDDGHGYIPRPTDQRIAFSMMVRDQMPNNPSIGATLNLFLSSGLPYGAPGVERYKATMRMPGYKRVDLGLYKDFALMRSGERRWPNGLKECRLGIDIFNLFDINNTISHFWVKDTESHNLAVPNYLTGRRINVKLSIMF
ncbi:MAG: TonB-dependent receptor plug domain-containing protein [Marinilabiliaceae bacterium]|nr:TonB-dependent receptor plug domain-containing protein [Marinilabiliaceae bacterium]